MKNQSLAALFRTLAASLSTPRRGISLASRPSALVLAGSIAALLSAEPAQATLLYWDLNGATANTAAAVTGAWNGTNAFWNTASTGTGGTAQAGTTNADDLFSPPERSTRPARSRRPAPASPAVSISRRISSRHSPDPLPLAAPGRNPAFSFSREKTPTRPLAEPSHSRLRPPHFKTQAPAPLPSPAA